MDKEDTKFMVCGEDVKAAFDWLIEHPINILEVDGIIELITKLRMERFSDLVIIEGGEYVQPFVTRHNQKNLGDLSVSYRPLRLLKILSAIGYIRNRASVLKVLSIGPRTEAELLGLLRLGFEMENITAIDLMTYSKYIEQGDMHDLPYEDNTFDVIIGGWIFAYSSNNQLVADEMMRVGKPGVLIAIGCNGEPYGDPDWANEEVMADIHVGGVPCLRDDDEYDQSDKIVHRFWNTDQIYRLFNKKMSTIFFDYGRQREEVGARVELMTVFRVKK